MAETCEETEMSNSIKGFIGSNDRLRIAKEFSTQSVKAAKIEDLAGKALWCAVFDKDTNGARDIFATFAGFHPQLAGRLAKTIEGNSIYKYTDDKGWSIKRTEKGATVGCDPGVVQQVLAEGWRALIEVAEKERTAKKQLDQKFADLMQQYMSVQGSLMRHMVDPEIETRFEDAVIEAARVIVASRARMAAENAPRIAA
jgi:hypothetical protein